MTCVWRVIKLGELVSFKTGKLDSNAAVSTGCYPFFTCSQETMQIDTYSFDTECVLLAGNNANGIFPLKYFHGKFDAYQRTYILRPLDSGQLDTKFLYFALRPKLTELRSYSTGAATKFLTLSILNETTLDLPPLPIQRRIASILSAYDDLIENHRKRIAILEEMARRLYREWFVHFRFPGHESVPLVGSPLGMIPHGWEVRRLLNVADVIYGFPFDSQSFNTTGLGLPMVRIRDVPRGESKTFTVEEPERKHYLGNGDILVGMDGEFHIGVWSGGVAVQNQRVARFVPRLNGFHRGLLFQAIQDPIKTLNHQIVGATVGHLGDMHIRKINVTLPPLSLRSAAGSQLDAMFDLFVNLRQQISTLRQTRDLLLPRLMSGTLSVTAAEAAVP